MTIQFEGDQGIPGSFTVEEAREGGLIGLVMRLGVPTREGALKILLALSVLIFMAAGSVFYMNYERSQPTKLTPAQKLKDDAYIRSIEAGHPIPNPNQ